MTRPSGSVFGGPTASNPVLLLIQQGPGLPMMNEARRFEHLLGLEKDFTVVYWDQRGCGRSLRGPEERGGITIDAMVSDTVSILEWLRDRFGREVFVIGFSFGGAIGAFAAHERPDLVETLVAVGMDIDGAAAGNSAYDFALKTAVERGKRRAIRQLECHRTAPAPQAEAVLDPGPLGHKLRWRRPPTRPTTPWPVQLLTSMVRSPDYSVGDIIRTLRGMGGDPGRTAV